MKHNNLLIVGLVCIVIVLLSQIPDAVSEEASLRCSRCPATCTSAHTYQVSCHNACRSVNPRLTEAHCEANRCVCREPATTTTQRSTTTKKKKNKIFG